MKQLQARKYLENMLFLVQKYRSNSKESFSGTKYYDLLPDINRWVHSDDYYIAPAIQKVLDGDHITYMDFYNMMTIIDQWIPELNTIAVWMGVKEKFPKPTMSWISEWDEE